MRNGKVVHCILQVAHVAEEVPGHFGRRANYFGGGEWWTRHGVGGVVGVDSAWWRWVPLEKRRDEDEEKSDGDGKDSEKVRI